MIFPLLFLKAKNYSLPDLSQSILIYNEMLSRYESYNSTEKPVNDIITIETFNSEIVYFQNFFNSLFYIKNLEVKIKKIYFELNLCLNQMGFINDSYELIEKMNTKYPNDIKIQFELAKDCLMLSKIDKFNEVLNQMKENAKAVEVDKNLFNCYNSFVSYTEILYSISQNDYEKAREGMTKLLNDDPQNILLVNNISMLNLFQNNVAQCYENLKKFATQYDCMNDIIKQNLNLMADWFKYAKIQ
ncbi:MAG: hypothetical protein MJ252_20725 [archaeon]|nr:hypothetical protein [archaeon]